jgi:Tol biopolymer transport system component
MSLPPGTRLGSYEIVAAIGAGGMGVVYRAHDAKLKRDVALKVISDALAHDHTLIARFQREAELLATLTHQHIAAVYGLEDIEGGRALVMELADGETLADRLMRGALAIDDVLSIARQLADAIEYAHEHGILHRDLKPANIKIGGDGAVKILDFGLAKALNAPGAGTSNIDSPTITSPAFTQAGIIIGTAAYMAPEQARGRAVDRRADIWAFGCVLYEMLTGLRTFDGETVTDTLAAVLTKEISLARLPVGTPPQIEQLLQRALTRDPRLRLQSMGEARIIIDQAIANPVPAKSAGARPRAALMPWTIAAAAVLAAAVMGWSSRRPGVDALPAQVTLQVAYPPGIVLASGSRPVLSHDERRIALGSRNGLIWIHDLETGKWTSSKADGLRGAPIWSPDGQAMAYLTLSGSLRVLDLATGATRSIAQFTTTGDGAGGSWCQSDVLLINTDRSSNVVSIPAAGGAATQLADVDRTKGELGFLRPQCLPGGKFAVVARSAAGYRTRRGDIQPAVGARNEGDLPGAWILLDDQRGGFITNEGMMMYQSLDARHEPIGNPEVVVRDIGIGIGMTLATAAGRAIAYRSTEAESDREFAWFDRQGLRVATLDLPGSARNPQLSSDGKMVAFETFQGDGSRRSIGILRFADSQRQQIAVNGFDNADPIWSADSRRLLFGRNTDTARSFYIRDLAGTTDQIVSAIPPANNQWPMDWSDDGSEVLFSDNNLACVAAALNGNVSTKPSRYQAGLSCQFSPDSRYVAFMDATSGAVVVEPFPPTGARWQISAEAGSEPRWHPNGRELFFLDVDQTLMATDVRLDPEFKNGPPHPLFRTRIPAPMRTGAAHNYDVARDGRFLINTVKPGTSPQALHVILNWRSHSQAAVPPR